MKGEQCARLTLIERYGEGFNILIDGNVGLSADNGNEDDAELMLKASSNLREITERVMRRTVREVEASGDEWDLDDIFTDTLWAMMQHVKDMHQRLDSLMPTYRQRGEYVYSLMVVTKENLAKSFDAMQNGRITIMEHDADASGLVDQSFESVDALMAFLEEDE